MKTDRKNGSENITQEQKDNLKNICSGNIKKVTRRTRFTHKCHHMWWITDFLVWVGNRASIDALSDFYISKKGKLQIQAERNDSKGINWGSHQ